MDMKLKFSKMSLIRLFLCVAAAIIFSSFLTYAITQNIDHYRQFSLSIVSLYSLVIVFGFKKVYPSSHHVFWQLCITFCLLGFVSFKMFRNVTALIESGQGGGANTLVHASIYQAQSNIAFQAALLLFTAYILLRLIGWVRTLIKK